MLQPVWRLLSVSVARAGLRSYPLVHSASGQCAGSSPVSSHARAIPGRGSSLVRTVAVQHQLCKLRFRSRWCLASCLTRMCAVV